ncbi:MAG: hypothetical protein WCL11_26635, partial [Verrucomicrobiota bacterium]
MLIHFHKRTMTGSIGHSFTLRQLHDRLLHDAGDDQRGFHESDTITPSGQGQKAKGTGGGDTNYTNLHELIEVGGWAVGGDGIAPRTAMRGFDRRLRRFNAEGAEVRR